MIEEILTHISHLNPFWIYVVLFSFSYIENVFPPSPSDVVVVIGGSLISKSAIHFFPTLLITTMGSVLGFMTLFYIGSLLDKKVLRAGKIKFISLDALDKAEQWFLKYGYFVILANRFMPGTRSVISFFAGLSELKPRKTALLAAISALIWNTIIIYMGIIFGNNVGEVDFYLSKYNKIVIVVTVLVILFFAVRYFLRKKRLKSDRR
ncbi:MAG TPA: DedA family protein [Ignavibacteriaceae bacterium]|nr:DedA family protein [Ignavibacteriaceae bacterium]